MSKPFKETALGKFLQSKGFNSVLNTVGSVVPGVKILNEVKDMVLGESAEVKLSPEEQQQFLDLYKMELEEMDKRFADTANARNREIELAKAGKKDILQAAVVITVLAAFVGITLFRMFATIPEGNEDALQELQITIRDMMFLVVGYYMGSSLGSKRKTDLIKAGNA